MTPRSIIKGVLIGIIALIVLVVVVKGWPFATNDATHRQVVQTFTGDLSVRFEPGFYYTGMFSKVTTYPNNLTIQNSPEEFRSPDADYWMPPSEGKFAEGDKAPISHTVKWDLPNMPDKMLALHRTYGNVDNLATTTLMQFQRQTASYSCQRMTSEEHYSSGESTLNEYFQDQLEYGQVLNITETKTAKLTDGTTKTYIDVRPKMSEDSTEVLRNMKSIQDIIDVGMTFSFASIDHVAYDPKIEEKLAKKIAYAADEANSKQELVTAQQVAETAKVKGQQLIEETRARETAAKEEAVIRAEKEAAVAAQNLLRDQKIAASTLALKRAEAEGDKLKVQAGLTPLERARIEKETAIGVAEALAGPNGITFPSIVAGGQGQGGSSGALQTLELKMLNDLARDMARQK